MPRSTAESMLISSLINTHDPDAGRAYGINPEHMLGFRDEYEWLLDFAKKFGYTPSVEKMMLVFPEFPYSDEEDDPRWSASEIHEKYANRTLMKKVMKAGTLLEHGETRQAYAEFEGVRYAEVAEKPANLLVDPGFMEDYASTTEERISLPWSTPQGVTGGIGPGELWYLLARQSHGKSALLCELAVNAACQGKSVLFYALEMTKRQLQVRTHAIMGHRLGYEGIDAHAMLHRNWDPKAYRALLGDIEDNVPGQINIHDLTMGFVKPSTVMARAGDYDLVIIDHSGLMHTDSGGRSMDDWRNAAIISNSLKEVVGARLARIVASVQINRDGDTLGWRPPKLKFAAQTDSVGQDADVAFTMKRYGKNAAVTSVEKNRHGDSGKLFWTNYLANVGNYAEITRDVADQAKDDEDDE